MSNLKLLHAAVSVELIKKIDQWRLKQGLPIISRNEAVKRLLEKALSDDRETRDQSE